MLMVRVPHPDLTINYQKKTFTIAISGSTNTPILDHCFYMIQVNEYRFTESDNR